MANIVIIQKSMEVTKIGEYFSNVCALPLKDFSFGRFLEIAEADLKTKVKDDVLDEALFYAFDFERYSSLMNFYHLITENKMYIETGKRRDCVLYLSSYGKVIYRFYHTELVA